MLWRTEILRDIPWDVLEERHREAISAVRDGGEARLLIAEPQATYTRGRSAVPADLLWDESRLRDEGIAVRQTSRGGKWTYHGPGQCVIYPVLSLKAVGYSAKSARAFVDDLREGIRAFIDDCGIVSEPREEPYGLYAGGAKLASFGLAFERGISSNGAAVYLEPQTAAFSGIHPCGTPGQRVTSLRELGADPTWEKAAGSLAESVKRVFNARKSWYSQQHLYNEPTDNIRSEA